MGHKIVVLQPAYGSEQEEPVANLAPFEDRVLLSPAVEVLAQLHADQLLQFIGEARDEVAAGARQYVRERYQALVEQARGIGLLGQIVVAQVEVSSVELAHARF